MTIKELTGGIVSRLRGTFSKENAEQPEPPQPAGGFSGYRPTRLKADPFDTMHHQAVQQQQQQEQPAEAQQPPMQDPVAQYAQNYGGWAGEMPQQQGAWQQPAFDPNAYQQPYQQAFQQPYAEQPYQQTFQQQSYEQPQPQQESNIRYMPGAFVDPEGNSYTHVERIAQLIGVSACFRIIEFLRNGESVIVNTESIGSEADIQRCLDMLTGAAFTLGCSMTKITQVKRAYLIAPKAVMVMQDTTISHWSDHEEAQPRQEMNQNPYAQQGAAYASSWQQPQTAWQQPQPAPSGMTGRQQTGWQQSIPSQERYSSDTRKGVYGRTGAVNSIFGN